MKKKIWILNHHAGNMFFLKGGRHYNFAKYLNEENYDVTVFCCNAKHNSKAERYFDDERLWHEHTAEEINTPFVYVKGRPYIGNGKQRILNMVDFYFNVQKAAKEYAKKNGCPDVIIGSSVHPLTCVAAIHLSRYFNCKNIVEIRDLWPESLVAYNIIKKNSLLTTLLYMGEKWIYKKADDIIFTMEGGAQYIIDQKWDKEHGGPVDINKVHYINNGVDLAAYDYNKANFTFEDSDLDNPDTYKVIYAGSFREANSQIMRLINAAKIVQEKNMGDIVFLLYGKGELTQKIKEICEREKINNIILKGFVEKKYMPYILSKCDLNIINLESLEILRYGGSQNKLFEYLASGHPSLTGEVSKFSIIANNSCGVADNFDSAEKIVNAICEIKKNSPKSEHIKEVAKKYDFAVLTQHLLEIVNG